MAEVQGMHDERYGGWRYEIVLVDVASGPQGHIVNKCKKMYYTDCC